MAKLKSGKIKFISSDNYQKHLSFGDRVMIEKLITENRDEDGKLTITLKEISVIIQKDPSSLSKEVHRNRISKKRKDYRSASACNYICANYYTCTITLKEANRVPSNRLSKTFENCTKNCPNYLEKICPYLTKFPWVCNGCPKQNICKLNKEYYYANNADEKYRENLVASRSFAHKTKEELNQIDTILYDALINKKQSIYHAYEINKDKLGCSLPTAYNYIDKMYLTVRNIDLRRKCRYRPKYEYDESKRRKYKISKESRTYEDYLDYIALYPDTNVVELDLVEGIKGRGEPFIMTLHFTLTHFQLGILIPNKEAKTIISVFDQIENNIGIFEFKRIFPIILTDNGTEFSDPVAIETDPLTGEQRTRVFYCHPYASYEKGECERNHEYIRYVFSKGTSFKGLNQNIVTEMMSNINSTLRPGIKSTPYELMVAFYGKNLVDKLGIKNIPPENVTLNRKKILSIK